MDVDNAANRIGTVGQKILNAVGRPVAAAIMVQRRFTGALVRTFPVTPEAQLRQASDRFARLVEAGSLVEAKNALQAMETRFGGQRFEQNLAVLRTQFSAVEIRAELTSVESERQAASEALVELTREGFTLPAQQDISRFDKAIASAEEVMSRRENDLEPAERDRFRTSIADLRNVQTIMKARAGAAGFDGKALQEQVSLVAAARAADAAVMRGDIVLEPAIADAFSQWTGDFVRNFCDKQAETSLACLGTLQQRIGDVSGKLMALRTGQETDAGLAELHADRKEIGEAVEALSRAIIPVTTEIRRLTEERAATGVQAQDDDVLALLEQMLENMTEVEAELSRAIGDAILLKRDLAVVERASLARETGKSLASTRETITASTLPDELRLHYEQCLLGDEIFTDEEMEHLATCLRSGLGSRHRRDMGTILDKLDNHERLARVEASAVKAAMDSLLRPDQAAIIHGRLDTLFADTRQSLETDFRELLHEVENFDAAQEPDIRAALRPKLLALGPRINHILTRGARVLTPAHLEELRAIIEEQRENIDQKLLLAAHDQGLPQGLTAVLGQDENRTAFTELCRLFWNAPGFLSAIERSCPDEASAATFLRPFVERSREALDSLDSLLADTPHLSDTLLSAKILLNARLPEGERTEETIISLHHDFGVARSRLHERLPELRDGDLQHIAGQVLSRHEDGVFTGDELLIVRTAYLASLAANDTLDTHANYLQFVETFGLGEISPFNTIEHYAVISNPGLDTSMSAAAGHIGGARHDLLGNFQLRQSIRQLTMAPEEWHAESLLRKTVLNALPFSRELLAAPLNRLLERYNSFLGNATVDPDNPLHAQACTLAGMRNARSEKSLLRQLGRLSPAIDDIASEQARLQDELGDDAHSVEGRRAAHCFHTLATMSGHADIKPGNRFVRADGAIVYRRMHNARMGGGLALLQKALATQPTTNDEVREMTAFIGNITFPRHMNFETFQSAFAKRHLSGGDKGSEEFTALLTALRSAQDTASFSAAKTNMQSFFDNYGLGDKIEAVVYVNATRRALNGQDLPSMFSSALASKSTPIPQSVRDTVMADYATAGEKSAGKDVGRFRMLRGGDVRRRRLESRAMKLNSVRNRQAQQAMDRAAFIAILGHFTEQRGVPFANLAQDARRPDSDHRKEIIASMMEALGCSQSMAEVFLDRQLRAMGDPPNLISLDQDLKLTLGNRVATMFRTLFSRREVSAEEFKGTTSHLLSVLKPGVRIGLEGKTSGTAGISLISLPITATGNATIARTHGITIDKNRDGQISLTMQKGFSAGINNAVSAFAGAVNATLRAAGDFSSGIQLRFVARDGKTAEEHFEAFLAAFADRESTPSALLAHVGGVAAVSEGGGVGAVSATVVPLQVVAGTVDAVTGGGISNLTGFIPLKLGDASVEFSAGGRTRTSREGDRVITERNFTAAIDLSVELGVGTNKPATAAPKTNPLLQDSRFLTGEDGASTVRRTTVPGPVGGRNLTVEAHKQFKPIQINRQTVENRGMVVSDRNLHVVVLDASTTPRHIEAIGIQNPQMAADIEYQLRTNPPITLTVIHEATPEAIARANSFGDRLGSRQDDYVLAGYELTFTQARAARSTTVGIVIPTSFKAADTGISRISAGVSLSAEGTRTRTFRYAAR